MKLDNLEKLTGQTAGGNTPPKETPRPIGKTRAVGVNPPDAAKPNVTPVTPKATPRRRSALLDPPDESAEAEQNAGPDTAAAEAEEPAPMRPSAQRRRSKLLEAQAEDEKAAQAAEAPAASKAVLPAGQIVVLLDTLVVKGNTAGTFRLYDLVKPVGAVVAAKEGRSDWRLLEFAHGRARLAVAFEKWLDESRFSGGILANSFSDEWKAVGDVLVSRAVTVMQGV